MQRYKQVFCEREERSEAGQETLLSVSAYTGVSPRSEIVDEGDYLSRAESLKGYKVCYPDDLVMNIMLAWNRGLGFSAHHGIVSPAYSVFEPRAGNLPRFLDYMVRSDQVILYYKAFSSGVIDSRLRLYPDTFGALHCMLPPADEQAAIAAFLDCETAKIGALIAEQEKLIALLAEKRQATISQAVTKGLNPSAPMKESGIPWLGQVPAHWSIRRLKYATDAVVDCPHETPTYDEDGPYRVIRTADVSEGRLHTEAMYSVAQEEFLQRIRRMSLESGDIVYGREGERWGFAAQVPRSDAFCLGQRMMQFRAKNSVHARFLMWQLNAQSTYRQGQMDIVGATSPHVNVGTIRNYVLTEPPLIEQMAVSDYLDIETAMLDGLDCEAERTIYLLKERRSALIAAAVTGQIDVRGEVAEVTA
ncbi:restriction endonuclease subunit S [Xanthomonas citri]|uniref:restriction endonuclease subunit S n=1 Tax=Xanthomonas citri TaxID=346 RepID=UPI000B4D6811|nr:restriction endonuclease subunit S [Xanthomonas citri]